MNDDQTREFVRCFLGEQLGSGVYRTVYEHRWDNRYVIKVANADREDNFANVYEWDLWQNARETKMAVWLAPCISISPCGLVLVQRRTSHIWNASELPEHIPKFFTDTKVANWGKLGKRVVCHDYGNNLATNVIVGMKKARWNV